MDDLPYIISRVIGYYIWKYHNLKLLLEFSRKHLSWGFQKDFRLVCLDQNNQFIGSYQSKTYQFTIYL